MDMSKSSDIVLDLVTRSPLLPEQILARREAEIPRTGLVGTLDGQWVDPTQIAKPVMQAPPQTID